MRRALLILFVCVSLCFCASLNVAGGERQEGGKAARGKEWIVKMTAGNKFDPPDITIKVGDRVKWVNEGGTHTATSIDIATGDPKKTFNTGTVRPMQEAVINFNFETEDDKPLKYRCVYHSGMEGTIKVTK